MAKYETELKQRQYDGKWVMWKKVPDPNETMSADWKGREMFFPYRWVPTAVYDLLIEFNKE